MTKTKEELDQLKEEYESLNVRLKELSEDELKQVTGGNDVIWIYEHSYDVNQSGSKQEVIGEWSIEDHSN